MEQRRFLLFIGLSFAILFGWSMLANRLFPPPPKPKQQVQQEADQKADEQSDAANPDEPGTPVAQADDVQSVGETDDPAAPNVDDADTAEGEEPAGPDVAQPESLSEHERQIVELGSLDPESNFFLHVQLDSRGAVISSVDLNDPRYKELRDPQAPLQVVGVPVTPFRTLETSVDLVDERLKKYGTSLAEVDWEVAATETATDLPGVNRSATFRFVSPDKQFEVRKRFWIDQIPVGNEGPRVTRDTSPDGYQVYFELSLKNLGQQAQNVQYTLQGPVHVPLENIDHTRKYRDIKVGFLQEGGGVKEESLTANEVADDEVEIWKQAFQYVGVDVQYFAALILPMDERPLEQRLAAPRIETIEQEIVAPAAEKTRTDISVKLTSRGFDIAPGGELVHEYSLYAGPKRQALLEPLGAADVLDYGWFGFVAKRMVDLLTFMHYSVGMPYGIAIIMMTILVRACMLPLSIKQARSAKKMKELQPRIAELKKKYEKDKEKFARAQMELFSKEGYNPLAGCLPIFFQLPIFIGLYTSLNASVDLRMAPFLWFDNLAAPDALFRLPFQLPFGLGSDFNLLPVLTVVLFVAQQKILMPPPADEQQEMQQKMMMWMSIAFGFFFWHFPAGLCVYFIASSLWGLGERKMLDLAPFGSAKTPADAAEAEGGDKKPEQRGKPEKPAATGWWGRLLESADAAANKAGASGQGRVAKQVNGAKGKRKKSRPRR